MSYKDNFDHHVLGELEECISQYENELALIEDTSFKLHAQIQDIQAELARIEASKQITEKILSSLMDERDKITNHKTNPK